jgi:hypothetical protein
MMGIILEDAGGMDTAGAAGVLFMICETECIVIIV